MNDHSVWKREDGRFVIWFNTVYDRWTIGSLVGSGGGIFGPSEFLCPGEVGSKWTYYATATNKILDGGDDVSLKCKGTYLRSDDKYTVKKIDLMPNIYINI